MFEPPFYNPRASAGRIACPVAVIAAEHDNLCPIRGAVELQALSPHVHLTSIPVGKPGSSSFIFFVY